MNFLWADDVEESMHEDDTRGENRDDEKTLGDPSNDESSSCRSSSIKSSRMDRHQRSRTNLSVSSSSNSSKRCSKLLHNERVPSAESECEILNLLSNLGYPMTQINGQRKLGPPPGWTKAVPDPNCEVFVGKIPRDLYENAIYPIFHNIGEIYEIRLMMDFSGTNRGYCFVMFTKPEYAQKAIKELNNWEIRKGRRIGVVASKNNCRLSIGRLPPDIDSAIVIKKFHEITDEVSRVSVYKNLKGQVRYALVLYKTHRGAAMARRRLLPERGILFDNIQISIDWAHPSMAPFNVVEDFGERDASGVLRITRGVTRSCIKHRGDSYRRGRDDFLDKSINNYLQEKSSNHRGGKFSDSTGHAEKLKGRGRSYSGQRKNQRNHSENENNFVDSREPLNKAEAPEKWEKRSRSFSTEKNSIVAKAEKRQKNCQTSEPDRSMENFRIPDSNGQELQALPKNSIPNGFILFNLFEHYASLPEMRNQSFPNGICGSGGVIRADSQNYFKNYEVSSNVIPDCQWKIDRFGVSKPIENVAPQLSFGQNGNTGSTNVEKENPTNQREHFRQYSENGRETWRVNNTMDIRALCPISNRNGDGFKNFPNNRGTDHVPKNFNGKRGNMGKNSPNSTLMKENDPVGECFHPKNHHRQDFDQSVLPKRDLKVRRGIYRQESSEDHENNRISQGFLGNQKNLGDFSYFRPEPRFPMNGNIPQNSYGTSSFADYRATLQKNYLIRGHSRPTFDRRSESVVENV